MSHDRAPVHGISKLGWRLFLGVGLVAALSVGPALAGAVYLPDHLLAGGGLTAAGRTTPPANLFTASDDLGDIYHALGDPGLVSDRIDIVSVSVEMWEFGNQGASGITVEDILEEFWGGWDPALEAIDEIVRFRPATMPDFPALSPWAVFTVATAADTPAWTKREPLQTPLYFEFPVGWARPGLPTFQGPVGDLFNGINYVTGLGSDGSSGYEAFDLVWDGNNWLPMDSQTFVAAYGNQVTFMIPLGSDVINGGPVNFNFGSFANFGTDVNFDPAQGGVDILQTPIDIGIDVPVFPITLMPAPVAATTSSTTTTTTTEAPTATTAAPAVTLDQTPTAVVEDGGGIPLWVLVLVGLIALGLLGGVLASWWWPPDWYRGVPADGVLNVNKVVNGTNYILCGAKGCGFNKSDGVCKAPHSPRPCAAGCVCRTFRRPKKNWEGEWEYMSAGKKPYLPRGDKADPEDPASNYVWMCLCVK